MTIRGNSQVPDNLLTWEEIVPEGGFPVKVFNQIQGSSGSHSHDFYELVLVEEGFCLHCSDDRVELMMAGDFIAIVPGQSHFYRCRSNVTIWNILFLPQALDGLMEEVVELPGMRELFQDGLEEVLHVHLSLQDREQAGRIVAEIWQEREQGREGWALRAKALLTDLMVLLSRVFGVRFSHQKTENPYLGYTLAAIEQIETGYRKDISVAGIAASLGISPDHLTRQFRQITGITPTEHIRRCRFAKALELLRRQYPVGEVCAQTGFRQLSYFSREFKNQFSMTPTAFQRQARERF